MTRASRLILLAAIASNGCATFPKTHEEGGAPWLRVDVAHVSVVTDQDVDAAKAAAAELDLWWDAMAQAIPIAASDVSPEKLTVIALRSHWEVMGVTPKFDGAFIRFPQVSLLYAGAPDHTDGEKVTRHELAHAFINARLHDVPLWLNEGLAKYLETADFDGRDGVVTWGALSNAEVREVGQWRRPGVATIIGESWPATDYALLTFRAGTLVHMLINRHESELKCFIAALAGGDRGRGAFTRCFKSFPSWDFEMNDYEFSFRFATRTAQVTPTVAAPVVSSVTDTQVHTWLALLDLGLADMVETQFRSIHVDRARSNLERALALDATEPLTVAAALKWLQLDGKRGAALTAGVVSAHPGDWRAWRLRAGTPGLPQAEAQRACEEMAALAPDGLDDSELVPCSRD